MDSPQLKQAMELLDKREVPLTERITELALAAPAQEEEQFAALVEAAMVMDSNTE